MSIKKITAIITACAIIFSVGCTRRDDDANTNAAIVSELERDEPAAATDDNVPKEPEPPQQPDDDVDEPMMNQTEDNDEDLDEPGSESVQPSLISEIDLSELSRGKITWGPGVRMNEDGRPEEPVALQQKYSSLGGMFIAPNNNKIYLTFDEGYENSFTPDILDTLKEKKVSAVFFVTYQYASSEPELMRRMVAEGHILGNHSTKHKSFPTLSEEEAIEDIMTLHNYVRANYGYTMSLFRPPMGEFSEYTLALAKSIGYTTVLWSFAYRDWEQDNQPISIQALDTINTRSHNGAIMLLHAVSRTNAEILGDAIDNLRARGFEFARLDWL